MTDDEIEIRETPVGKPAPEQHIPTRPVSGYPITSDWGGQIHDAVFYPAGNVMASGTWSRQFSSAQSDYAEFLGYGENFAAPPAVVVSLNSEEGGQEYITVRATAVTNTSFALKLTVPGGGLNIYGNVKVSWIARGWKAGTEFISMQPAEAEEE